MYSLLWLLLPVAAASGWWAARYSQRRLARQRHSRFSSAYGQGLNYLLNEEPDKAVEVLVQLVEVNPETVELHLALGSLFRRRGEVDRAIRVHQNIVERKRLSEALRTQATLELARDYLKAGVLDRAEQLFNSLLGRSAEEQAVCRHLADIYQQEKEWSRAIEVARRIAASDPGYWRNRIAHYHCELGDAALAAGDHTGALVAAERACYEDPGCVRALLLKASACQHAGDFQAAIEAYQSLGTQSRQMIPEIREELQSCYRRLPPGSVPDTVSGDGYESAAPVTRFRCEECGFSSRKLFWQCPGCKSWSSVKPLG